MSKQDSSSDEGIPRSETTVCASCGDVIDESEWFPIRGQTDDDDEFRLFSFCSDDCLESWGGP